MENLILILQLTPSIVTAEVSTPEWSPIMYGVGASM